MTDLVGSGVRVLLIGTAAYTGPSLPALPAVARSLSALAAVLRDRCGVGERQLRVLLDPPDAQVMAEAVAQEAGQADSVLLIYYLGHGLLGSRDELYLAASSTDALTPGLAAHQALPFAAITEALTACRASSVVVVLDCCFSGRADFAMHGGVSAFTLPAAHGMYLLSSAERLALSPPEQRYTLFTGAFIELLTNGDPLAPGLLTLDGAYDHLFRVLRAAGGPLPRRQAADRSGELILAVNPAQTHPAEAAEEAEAFPGRCPYPGLAAFGVDDAELFAGRKRLTTELITAASHALAESMPLVMVGASGSGKTSLLHAGLLARLRVGPPELPGSAGWPWLTMTPGDHPLHVLASRLDPSGTVTAEALRRDPARAVGLAAGLLSRDTHPEARLVLVIDQLEQLFLLGASPAEQAAFLDAVSAVSRPPGGIARPALVVLALRADFYGRAAEHPGLLAALTHSQFLVGPMGAADMRAAIEQPARVAGLRLDDGLADVILHELGTMDAAGAGPGALPLLSHTMWAVWERRAGARLTVAGYRATGGVAQAIATSADATYHALHSAERTAARRMLPRLVRVADEAPDTARPQQVLALTQGLPDQEAARSALNKLAEARLVTADRNTVRISHEALLRSWPLLSEWIDADRDWLRVSQRLADDAWEWRRSGRDRSRLYRGGTLAAVREWAAVHGRDVELTPEAAEFLAAATAQERHARRLRVVGVGTLAVLLLFALAGGGLAVAFQRQAVGQRNLVLSRFLASEADQIRATNPSLATQLSLIAYHVDPGDGARAIFDSQGSPGFFDAGDPVLDMAQQASGRVLAISTGTALRLWDTGTGHQLSQIDGLPTGPVVIGSRRNLLVASVGNLAGLSPTSGNPNTGLAAPRGQIRLWNIDDPAHPRSLAVLPAQATSVVALALSPDERILVAASPDGVLHVWDVSDPRHPVPLPELPGDGREVVSLAFSPRGRVLATSGTDHTIRLWNLASPAHARPLARIAGPGTAPDATVPVMRHLVEFSPDGRLLAAAAGKRSDEARVWDVTNPRAPRLVALPPSDVTCDQVMGLAFFASTAPAGPGLLVSCSGDLEIDQLPQGLNPGRPGRGTELADLQDSGGTGGQVLIAPHRRWVLNVSPAGVRVWNITDPAQPGALASALANTGLVPGTIAFTSSGRPLMADTAYLSRIRLWNLSNPRDPKNLGLYPEISPSGSGAEINALAGGAVALSPDGSVLAYSAVVDGRAVVVLRRTATPDAPPAATITGLGDGAIALAFGRDGHLLAVSDNANYIPAVVKPPTVKLFNLPDPGHPHLLASVPGNTFHLAISPDGRLLTGYTANSVLSWDIADTARPTELPTQRLTPTSFVTDGAFSPNGALLAVGDGTGLVHLWRVRHDRITGPPAVINEPEDASSLAFSPDGRTLALPGLLNGDTSQPSIDLWDVANPDAPQRLAQWATPGGDQVNDLIFSLNGDTLAVEGQFDLNLWDMNPVRVAAALCTAVGDPISRAQWTQYIPSLPYRPPCAAGAGR